MVTHTPVLPGAQSVEPGGFSPPKFAAPSAGCPLPASGSRWPQRDGPGPKPRGLGPEPL